MNTLKPLLNGRLATALCALLGIEATETEIVDYLVTLAQQSSGEVKGLLRVAVLLVYAWFQHPVAVKKPLPPASEPAVSGPSGEL